jgi:hypothetical protein
MCPEQTVTYVSECSHHTCRGDLPAVAPKRVDPRNTYADNDGACFGTSRLSFAESRRMRQLDVNGQRRDGGHLGKGVRLGVFAGLRA